MAVSIFTVQVPAVPNASDGAPGLSVGTCFYTTVPGSVTHIRWRFPDTLPAGAVNGRLYEYNTNLVAGTLLGQANFVAPVAGVWNTVALPAPVVLTPNNLYIAVVWTPDRYVATNNFFTSSALTNAPLVAIQDATNPTGEADNPRNGKFHAGAAPAYPDNFGSQACYFADVVFEEAGADVAVADVPGPIRLAGSPEGLALGVTIPSTPGPLLLAGSPEHVDTFDQVNEVSWGIRLGNSPDEVEAGAPSTTDNTVLPMLIAALVCLNGQMDLLENPPRHRHLRPGASFSPQFAEGMDECCEGIAWVRFVSQVPSNNFPVGETASVPAAPAFLAVTVEFGATFCVPMTQTGDDLASMAQWLEATRHEMEIRQALQATMCCLRDLYGADAIVEGQALPLENEANCSGLVISAQVRLPYCC